MLSIMTVPAEEARGLRRLLVWQTRRGYGGVVPGIFEVLMPDLKLTFPTGWLYNHLHMRKGSPLSRLQREMLASPRWSTASSATPPDWACTRRPCVA